MVARSPTKQQRKTAAVVAPPLSPTLLRETVKKVEKCMARLQELQYTVAGSKKLTSVGRNNLRFKNANSQRSPSGKLPTNTEWQRMSLPAMLLGETIGEILQASQFARNIVEAVSSKAPKPVADDPKTPLTERRKQKPTAELSELHARRKREKQVVLQSIRSESNMPSIHRAKSRINFKTSPECGKENCRYIANRVSPRNRPWVKKTVLFPNPLFHSSPTSKHQKFSKTKSPVIVRSQQTPHKFLIKSPPSASKFQVKIKGPPISISPKASAAAKMRRSFSPSRLANKFVSPLRNRTDGRKNEGDAVAKMRRSFSPSRLANRLVSPLRSRKVVQKNEGVSVVSGLKQRPVSSLDQFPPRRI
ncbi:hypothetical protein CDL12_20847 [Handroanthus impetiginosus]|uniref:Microtubule-binding protein TANGLED1 n=1 Tax=Handroanthus impetiginosus TaxID=429701 RepID=A0A2G9GMU0_9LAMI|nr:hypothetical protein CDL12_20847 [Handroanthus impetiginosus]